MPDFSKPVGLLAESWTYDPAALTWTFKLREGVKGCTGDTFTSADVIYTFARAKSVSGAAPIGWFLSNVASIKGFTTDVFGKDSKAKELGDGIVALDDYTVQIKQSQPNALLLPVLAIFGLQIFDKKIMEAHATAQDPWSHDYGNTVNAPGFGSYCLDSWQKGQSISYKANTNYYRGKPAIDKVVVRRVPESSNRVAVLRTGQAQLVTGLTPKEFDSLRSIAGITVEGVTGNQNLFEHMNFKSPPFDNPKVREAVSHAIPYDQIIATGYFGQATIWQGFVPSGYPGYVPSAKDFVYDPAKAKALLAEAGFPDGKGLEKFVDNLQLSYVSEKEFDARPDRQHPAVFVPRDRNPGDAQPDPGNAIWRPAAREGRSAFRRQRSGRADRRRRRLRRAAVLRHQGQGRSLQHGQLFEFEGRRSLDQGPRRARRQRPQPAARGNSGPAGGGRRLGAHRRVQDAMGDVEQADRTALVCRQFDPLLRLDAALTVSVAAWHPRPPQQSR